MSTAREIIQLALKECGVIGVGQTPLAEDVNDAFILLSRMVAQWQRKRWLIPALMDISMPGNSQRSNTIGNGQYYNHPRPDKIQSAYVVQTNGVPDTIIVESGADFNNDFSNDFNIGGNITEVSSGNLGLNVSIPLRLIFSYEDYSRLAVKSLLSLPNYLFYDAAVPYGNVFAWPIPDSRYEVHLIVKSALGFSTSIKSGVISNYGDGYIDGEYLAVPLLNVPTLTKRPGIGVNATANISVLGGTIAEITIVNPGEYFRVNDFVTVDTGFMGFDGSGFRFKITNLVSNLDANLMLEPEYDEALHYNLAIRLCSMYQLSPQQSTVTLAKVALNTIKIANTQVPTMGMPNTLTQPRAYNIYSDYGY